MSNHRTSSNLIICPIKEADIDLIVISFAYHHWSKPRSTFAKYLKAQETGEGLTWVAWDQDQLAGYITLKWQSLYDSFRKAEIPEIMDLNVLPPYQKKGIGSALLQIAEDHAFQKGSIVGLGVGLYEGYGSAQNIYISRRYRPDGLGITYNYKRVEYGEKVPLDDDLVLWLVKTIN